MSTIDDKPKAVAEDETGAQDITSSPDNADKNGQDKSAGGPILLFFILGFAASLILGWVIFPKLLYSKKQQPINFNHKMHNELVDEECESCHFFRADGSFSGIPRLDSCIECHEEVQGEDKEEINFVEQYVEKGREVPWLVYARQPDSVFFSHAAHIKMGKLECVTCHGNIGESESTRTYEANLITGYSRDIWGKNIAGFKRNTWDRMKMDDCAECHEEAGKKSSVQTHKEACFVCHK